MQRMIAAILFGGLAAAGSPAHAVDGLSGDAGLGVAISSKEAQSPKFREFWYDMKSGFALVPEADVKYEFGLGAIPMYAEGELNGRTALERRATEGDAGVEAGSYGMFKVYGDFKRIGHQFAHDAQTLYDGIGTDTLTLHNMSANDRFRLQTYNSKGFDVRPSILNFAEQTANFVDIGLRRDIVHAGAEMSLKSPFNVGVDFTGEQRRGARPFGAIFGSSPGAAPVLEVAEPINYDTTDIRIHAGYADTLPVVEIPLAAEVSYDISNFTNNYESFTVENPFTMTDSATGVGAATGRYSLAPSNSANTWGASLSARLPFHVDLSGHAQVATLDQNADLLPFTSNALLSPGLVLPRSTAEAKVENSLYEGALGYSPTHRIHWRASVSQNQHLNQTEDFIGATVVVGDTSLQNDNESEYVSFTARTTEVEQTLDLGHRSHLVAAYENEIENFQNGSASRLTTNAFKLGVDTRAWDWASIRVSGEHGVRDSVYPDYPQADGELPWMRKYYAAARNRDKVVAITTLSFIENTDITIHHVQGRDVYPESQFGLQNEDSRATTVDLTYTVPDEGLTVNTYATQEAYLLHQRSRQWNPGSVGDPYTVAIGVEDPSNWTADATSVINTIGMSTDLAIVPDTLMARLEGSASVTKGKVAFDSVVGATPFNDNNRWIPADFPNVDSSRYLTAGLSLSYRVMTGWLASLGYRYDRWQYQDSLLNDNFPMPVAQNATWGYNSLISMGIIPRDYEVHTVYAKVSANF